MSGDPVTVGGLSILKHNLDAYAEAYKALSAAVKAKAASEITHCDLRTVSIDGSVDARRDCYGLVTLAWGAAGAVDSRLLVWPD
jgi:hypothetical protein